MPELNLVNANPGDVVVPLADVLELLQSALNSAELQQLSTDLIARRTTFVQAGDVITAELMNQVLADIGNLQARVAELENGIPSQEAPRIFFVNPNTGVRIGETLTVVGENLAPANIHVQIGNRAVAAFNGSSQGKTLTFVVPPMLSIPQGGADVMLVITNDFGDDDILVRVLPSLPQELIANLRLRYTDSPEEALTADTPYPVTLNLSAFTSLAADFEISASLDGDDDWTVEIQGDSTITIPQSQHAEFTTDINLLVTTGAAGSANLTVHVEAVDHPDQSKTSAPLPLAIGDIPEVNTDISLSEQNIESQNFDAATNTIRLNQGQTMHFGLQFSIAFHQQENGESQAQFEAKNTYTFSTPTIIPPGPWSLTNQTEQIVVANRPGKLVDFAFQLTCGTGAAIASELRYLVSRNGSSEPPFELSYTLTNT